MENQVMAFPAAGEQLLSLAPEVILAETLETVVATAESAFDGEASEVCRDGRFVEIELMCDAHIVEAVYDADSGALLESETVLASRRGKRVARALRRAVLSLADAMDVAKAAVGPGESLGAGLRTAGVDGGRRFDVALRTSDGVFDIQVDAASGSLLRVIAH